jgi:hypothetical protein
MFSFRTTNHHTGTGDAISVWLRLCRAVTTDGELLTTPALEGVTHAATAGGADVIGAGTAQVATGGGQTLVFDITAQSGHYLNGASAAQSQAVVQTGVTFLSGFVSVLADFAGVIVIPQPLQSVSRGGCPVGGCQQ